MLRKPWEVAVTATVGVVIVVATLLVLVLIPVPQNFAISGAVVPDMYASCTGIDPTSGTAVAFHWSTQSWISFVVVSCSANQIVYEANGTSGFGYFVAAGGDYMFGATCGAGTCATAEASGYYTAPLL